MGIDDFSDDELIKLADFALIRQARQARWESAVMTSLPLVNNIKTLDEKAQELFLVLDAGPPDERKE